MLATDRATGARGSGPRDATSLDRPASPLIGHGAAESGRGRGSAAGAAMDELPARRGPGAGDRADRPQPLGGVLGGEVALGLGEQLVADHELADVRAQQRRVEVARGPASRSVGRRRRTAPGASPSSTGTAAGTARRSGRAARRSTPARPSRAAASELGQPRGRPPRDQQRLERPGRPERHDHQPLVVLDDDPRAARLLVDVVEQQPAPGRRQVRPPGVASSRAASTGSAVPAQIWPCGCGFEAPIASPRFSKTWTQRIRRRRARVVCSAHTSMTRRTAVGRHPRRASGRGAARSTRPGRPTLALGTEEAVARRSRRTCPAAAPRSRCEDERLAVVRVAVRRSPGRCPGRGSSRGRSDGRSRSALGLLGAQPRPAGPPGRDEDPLVDERVVAPVRVAGQVGRRATRVGTLRVRWHGSTSTARLRRAAGARRRSSSARPRRLERCAAPRRSSPASVMRTSAWSSRAIELIPMTPHFEWSATTTSRRPASMSARSVSASSRFGQVNPECGSMPWTPTKTRSTWTRPQRGDRERADERLRRRPHAAGQDDRLVGPADLVEDVGDPDRVGDDGQARDVGQPLGERVGRRPGRDRRSPSRARRARRPHRRSRPSRPAGGSTWRRTPGSNRALPVERGRAAVDLLEQAALVEDLEVAADGHVRHAELADEVGDA